MGLPSNNIAFLNCIYPPVTFLYRLRFFILSLAITTATFSFYMEESRAYSEYNLSINSEIKKSLINKKRKKRRNSKTSLEAVLFEKIAVRKRNNLNLKVGFFSGNVVEYTDRSFQNQRSFIFDVGAPCVIDYVKPDPSRSPPYFS